MSYQIRHKEWGVFQGKFLGLGMWYPMSDSSYLGLLELKTMDNAMRALALVSEQYDPADFSIEDFDHELDKRLINETRHTPTTVQTVNDDTKELSSDGGTNI